MTLITKNLTNQERISLTDEIALISPQATPFLNLLLSNGRKGATGAVIHTYRSRKLDNSDATVAEGNEAGAGVNSDRKELSNICEVFQKVTSVSGSAQASEAVGDLMAQEIEDRLAEVKLAIEKHLIDGVKADGSVDGIRKMQGVIGFVPAENKVGGNVSEDMLKALARKLWEAGNEGADIYCLVSADDKEIIDGLFEDRYNYNHVTNDFGLLVSSLATNYGVIKFIVDRYQPVGKLVAFDLNKVAIKYLKGREPHYEDLAKNGDYLKGQVVAECTLEAQPEAVALLEVPEP